MLSASFSLLPIAHHFIPHKICPVFITLDGHNCSTGQIPLLLQKLRSMNLLLASFLKSCRVDCIQANRIIQNSISSSDCSASPKNSSPISQLVSVRIWTLPIKPRKPVLVVSNVSILSYADVSAITRHGLGLSEVLGQCFLVFGPQATLLRDRGKELKSSCSSTSSIFGSRKARLRFYIPSSGTTITTIKAFKLSVIPILAGSSHCNAYRDNQSQDITASTQMSERARKLSRGMHITDLRRFLRGSTTARRIIINQALCPLGKTLRDDCSFTTRILRRGTLVFT